AKNVFRASDAMGRFLGTDLDRFPGEAADERNLYLGYLAGTEDNGSGNTFVGFRSGFHHRGYIGGDHNTYLGEYSGEQHFGGGKGNTFLGSEAGRLLSLGNGNVFLGWQTGLKSRGDDNTYLGAGAGFQNLGNGNVFLGKWAGASLKEESNKLYIANDSTTSPLIYGAFDHKVLAVNGSLGVGIQAPERPIHLRASNAIFRIDRDRDDPGFAIVRYDQDFQNVWKSFYFYTRAQGTNDGKFVIADWQTQVAGPSTPRFVIDNQGDIGIGPRFENLNQNPTARLHIDGSVRFQNLPQGSGQALVIDAQGNVFIRQNQAEAKSQHQETLLNKIAQLEARIAQLESQEISRQPESLTPPAHLYQNQPNPFHENTRIKMYLSEDVQTASLYIYDMQGHPLKTLPLNERGEVVLEFAAGSLAAGMYMYALLVDHQEVDVKRMIIE
ncbi:MAG: T9SS type A sorting domain-containing protein, partial [Bacteroidota bacterium]